MSDETRRSRRATPPPDSLSSTQRNPRIDRQPTVVRPRAVPQPPAPPAEPPPFAPPYAYPYPYPVPQPRRRRGLFGRLVRLAVGLVAGGILTLAAAAALYAVFPPPRMNILLLGVDSRPGEGYVTRSDTIILTTIDPGQPYMGMLSIPRDLYVAVPGHNWSRINAAHTYGESAGEGGGAQLVAQTVANNFGVPVHRTLRMNFQGFVAIVDAAGGIDIDVPAPIRDDAYPTANYGTISIYFEPGRQHMDGERALQYARTRHSSNDFYRAARQQEVIVALTKKLANPANWWRLPGVYVAFISNVETDLTVFDVALLLPAVIETGPDNIQREVLSRENSRVVNANIPGDPYLLAPNWQIINPLVDDMFRR